ncbi:MAG TPA: hypothetical protein VEY33_16020 [Gemmatimonadota bacterium]|nr:hypothetical protein [Gemmatimonadota bacterium]
MLEVTAALFLGLGVVLVAQFPVSRDQVKAVLEFAARSLDAPVPAR